MTELEILRKGEGASGGHVSVRLEHVHCEGVSGEEETTNELGEYVEGDLHVGNGVDDTRRRVSINGTTRENWYTYPTGTMKMRAKARPMNREPTVEWVGYASSAIKPKPMANRSRMKYHHSGTSL